MAMNAMTCSRSAANPPKWSEKIPTMGLPGPLTAWAIDPGMAIANTA